MLVRPEKSRWLVTSEIELRRRPGVVKRSGKPVLASRRVAFCRIAGEVLGRQESARSGRRLKNRREARRGVTMTNCLGTATRGSLRNNRERDLPRDEGIRRAIVEFRCECFVLSMKGHHIAGWSYMAGLVPGIVVQRRSSAI